MNSHDSKLVAPIAKQILKKFIAAEKATSGLTKSSETWLRTNLGSFLDWLHVPLEATSGHHIMQQISFNMELTLALHGLYVNSALL